jgi:hypothetical protein
MGNTDKPSNRLASLDEIDFPVYYTRFEVKIVHGRT